MGEHVRCGWNWPVSSVISEEDNALRVLSLGKSSVHLHTVCLNEVKTKRDQKRPINPRETFDRNQDESWENKFEEESKVEENEVKVYGELPKFPAKNSKNAEPVHI